MPGVGGAGAIRFAADGTIADSYSILTGTSTNCAGGPTPWGTWLSCEETDTGQVWECDPTGERAAVALPALGVFAHEAAAVDPVDRRVYLTEDRSDGSFYRFTPAAYPDLSAGALEVAAVAGDGRVTWLPVPDPSASSAPTREQVAAATPFDGGEGCWWDRGLVYFSTKGDNRIRVLDTAANTITVLYDGEAVGPDAPLTGVDNIVVTAPSGDVFVAEDGGNMEVVLITPEGEVAPFVQITGQAASEVTGPAFDPSGTRLYFSSQRGGFPLEVPIPGTPGNGLGITYEVTGPFRRQATVPAQSTPTTIARAAAPSISPQQLPSTGDPDRGLGLAGAAAVGLAAAVARLRTRAHPETD